MSASSVVRVELRRDAGRIGPELGPWLRRTQIARFLGSPDPHGLAQIVDRRGELLGWGLVSAVSNITVRMLAFGSAPLPEDWLQQRLVRAFAGRERYGFAAQGTTGMRMVNSEGDGLPGLVVDRYGDALVVQLGTAPMAARELELLEWLRPRWSGALHVVVPDAAAKHEGMTGSIRDEHGAATLSFSEHGLALEVAAPPSQKTGAYHDQRANRRIVAKLARAHGGALLDVGCHVGGFALHARREGVDVVALDRSRGALEHARANAARNALDGIVWVEADMFEPLRDPALAGPFGTIVLDPPKIAVRRSDVERAQQAMSRVATELALRLADGGHLVLCSCSHHLGRESLDRIALATGAELTRVMTLGAGVDHPIAPGHREGEYLRVNVYQRR
ncbi:MAG: class I SAM-dependent rRNA methyltransferase [Deltaproteobacteria bacterium]|nr:class I SAM-dependent rRNA methyltransferase [Nannocystaceae bacterium]